MSERPVLWHIPVSHYSEKARWALAHKGDRARAPRAAAGGPHRGRALAHPRRPKTFPVLQLDGRERSATRPRSSRRSSGASRTARRSTRPTPASARRALELEDYFDEQLGPQIRLLAWHELTRRLGDGMGRGGGRRRCPSRLRERRAAARRAGRASARLYVQAALPRRRATSAPPPRAPRCSPRSTGSRRARAGGEYLVGDAVHGRRPDRGLALLPARLPARGRRRSLPELRRPRLERRSSRPAARAPGERRWVGARSFARAPASPPPSVAAAAWRRSIRLTRSRRSPRSRPGRRTAAARRRSPSARGGRPVAPELEHQVGEAVDHRRRLVEAGRALDQPERLDPTGHPVELAELRLQRGEDRERRQARRLVALLDRELARRPGPSSAPRCRRSAGGRRRRRAGR